MMTSAQGSLSLSLSLSHTEGLRQDLSRGEIAARLVLLSVASRREDAGESPDRLLALAAHRSLTERRTQQLWASYSNARRVVRDATSLSVQLDFAEAEQAQAAARLVFGDTGHDAALAAFDTPQAAS